MTTAINYYYCVIYPLSDELFKHVQPQRGGEGHESQDVLFVKGTRFYVHGLLSRLV